MAPGVMTKNLLELNIYLLEVDFKWVVNIFGVVIIDFNCFRIGVVVIGLEWLEII